MLQFLRNQLSQIRERGYILIMRKLVILVALPFALPVVLLIRAIRPLLLIRFGVLMSDRIGHFAINTEMYLCERDAGLQPRGAFDIFMLCSLGQICNEQLKTMWARQLRIWQWAYVLDRLNRCLPGWQPHVVQLPSDHDKHGLLRRYPRHLEFTSEEKEAGWSALEKMGIKKQTPFVCFHARDSAYLGAALPRRQAEFWRYHDYRDAKIHTFILAAEELVCRGYITVRMGAIVREALRSSHPNIIDYALKYRTDFLDIFLPAHCTFFLSTTAGIMSVPGIFRVPIAFVNYISLETAVTWGSNDLVIFKTLWSRELRRVLTFSEMLASGAHRMQRTSEYQSMGLEPIDNTPEEIRALAVEMDERLKGTWKDNEEDDELQKRFAALFDANHKFGQRAPRVGAEFLRQNRHLLG